MSGVDRYDKNGKNNFWPHCITTDYRYDHIIYSKFALITRGTAKNRFHVLFIFLHDYLLTKRIIYIIERLSTIFHKYCNDIDH